MKHTKKIILIVILMIMMISICLKKDIIIYGLKEKIVKYLSEKEITYYFYDENGNKILIINGNYLSVKKNKNKEKFNVIINNNQIINNKTNSSFIFKSKIGHFINIKNDSKKIKIVNEKNILDYLREYNSELKKDKNDNILVIYNKNGKVLNIITGNNIYDSKKSKYKNFEKIIIDNKEIYLNNLNYYILSKKSL